MYTRSNLLLVERYSKKEGLTYVPERGIWEYSIRRGEAKYFRTEDALPLLMEGSLIAGAAHVHELSYRGFFGSNLNSRQQGEHAYHVVMMIPQAERERFRDVTLLNMRGETVSLADLEPFISPEHVGMRIPLELRKDLLSYTAIYWGSVEGRRGEGELTELYAGERIKEIMQRIDKEGYEGEGCRPFHRI